MEDSSLEKNLERTVTVAYLNSKVEAFIDKNIHIENIWIAGECSNVKIYRSGHIYFSLKDEEAQVTCVMFKSYADKLSFQPKDGQKVLVKASASFYAKEGRFQLKVFSMKEDGLGSLYEKFLYYKDLFTQKGYFAENIKKKLPLLPQKCGVVTSAHGAVIRDIVHVSTRRYPQCQILLYPSAVQGEAAVPELIAGLQYLDKRSDIDVIIIGRGGGSAEDLWCFNSPLLVEAIYHCQKPVVSAVGHETDYTLCDFVADERAPTPSAAAEKVFPVATELAEKIAKNYQKIKGDLLKLTENSSLRLLHAEERLQNRGEQLSQKNEQRLYLLQSRLNQFSPHQQIQQKELVLHNYQQKLMNGLYRLVKNKAAQFANLKLSLTHLSPNKPLERGYTMTKQGEKIISSVKDLKIGDKITVDLADGSLACAVELISYNLNK